MPEKELGKVLKDMYDSAPSGYKVLNVQFFGIKYADAITKHGYRISEIIKAAGLNKSYAGEIRKGIKLSRYVIPK